MCLWWSALVCRGSSSGGTSETLLQLERAVPAAEGASGAALASSWAAAAAAAFGSLLIAPKAFSSERRPPAWLGDSCFTSFPVFQAEPIPSREASLPFHPPKKKLVFLRRILFYFFGSEVFEKATWSLLSARSPPPPCWRRGWVERLERNIYYRQTLEKQIIWSERVKRKEM